MVTAPLHTRILAGDEAAFVDLFKQLNPNLIRVAHSITGNRASAEEVAQETWLAVLEKLHSFKGEAPLHHWILRIASNKARTRGTRDARTAPLAPPDPKGQFTDAGTWAEPPSMWDEITPERLLAGRQTWQRVCDVIQTLPAMQQAILSLLEQEKMSAADCAEILATTPANVRVHLHRAREKIRQTLDAQEEIKKPV